MMVMLCVTATGERMNAFAKMDFRATGRTALVDIENFNCHDYHCCTFILH